MAWQDAEGGVDTFMGLCKFPGREQRHRIDIKVTPGGQEAKPWNRMLWL